MLIDTHCHLTDERYTSVAEVLNEFKLVGGGKAITVGYDLGSSEKCNQLADNFLEVYSMVGVHPSDANQLTESGLELLKTLSKNEKCVAIGEIGLDYHYDGYDKQVQQAAFVSQIELANQLNLPISIHSREATKDTLDILKSNKKMLNQGGVMHCFSGSVETAREYLNLGLYISFAGPVTFKNAGVLTEVAKFVPNDRFLIETDSPYLTPHPFRGSINQPKMVDFVAQKLAEIKKLDYKTVVDFSTNNAFTLFKKLKWTIPIFMN